MINVYWPNNMTLTLLYQINIAFERNADLLAGNTSFNF